MKPSEQEMEQIEHGVDMLRRQADYKEAENMQLKRDLYQSSQSNLGGGETKTLVEYESDNREVLDQIFHLLLNHKITFDNRGNELWQSPANPDDMIFSESGATMFMNLLLMYINKTQIWSNFSEDKIEEKCKFIFNALADYIYTDYEYLIYYQTQDELVDKYKRYAKDFDLNDAELFYFCSESSADQIRKKLKHIERLFISIDDLIHANLCRALNGSESAGRRKTTFVNQQIGGSMYQPDQQQKPGMFGGRR